MVILFTPGPVELTDEIRMAQAQGMISHRGEEYRKLHAGVVEKLRKLFNSDDAFIVTASGAGGVEAALSNMLSRNGKALCMHNGVFGKRLTENAKIYCDNVEELSFEYGKGINLERARAKIDESKAEVLAMVYNETSTAVANGVKEIARYAKGKGMYVIIDGISAIAAHEMDMRGWGVDVCTMGSQKGVGAPPGLVMLGVNNSAFERIEKNRVASYYFNLIKYREFQKKNETPFTPAVSTLFALDVALDVAFGEGIAKRIERHAKMGERVRKEISGMGFELLAEKGFESNSLTAFKSDRCDYIKGELLKKGMAIAGGMGDMKGKVLRIAHMGNFKEENYDALFSAMKGIVG